METITLDGLWDKASGVFNKWIDFESFKFQQELAADTRNLQAQLQNQQQPVAATWSNPDGVGSMVVPLVVGGLLIAGVVFIANR